MNYYDILGIPQDATTEQIKQRYKVLIKTYHPDLYNGDKTYANEKTKEITQAYKILVKPETRNNYDMLLYDEYLEANTSYDYNYEDNHDNDMNEFNNDYKDDEFFKKTTHRYKHTFFDFVDNTYDNITTKSLDYLFRSTPAVKALVALIVLLLIVIFFLLQIRQLQESYLQGQNNGYNSYNSSIHAPESEYTLPDSILNAITEEDLKREYGDDIINQIEDGTFKDINELKTFYYYNSEP